MERGGVQRGSGTAGWRWGRKEQSAGKHRGHVGHFRFHVFFYSERHENCLSPCPSRGSNPGSSD